MTLARARCVDVLHIFDIFYRFGIKARLASCKPMQCQTGPPNVKGPSNCNVEKQQRACKSTTASVFASCSSCCFFTSGNNPIAPFTKSSGCLIRASTLTPGPVRPLQPPCTTSAHDHAGPRPQGFLARYFGSIRWATKTATSPSPSRSSARPADVSLPLKIEQSTEYLGAASRPRVSTKT